MKIVEFSSRPDLTIRYLNAGRSAGQFYEDQLPIHVAKVDRLPNGLSALVATADLQGRELFEESPVGPIRLLGEALPLRLVKELFPALSVDVTGRIGVLLAGDFYTVPAIDRRGGDGDVTSVWHAFSQQFDWVAGVPGNHDIFGDSAKSRPRFPERMHFLDGDTVEVEGLRIAGLGGIIGNLNRPHRRSELDYLATLESLLKPPPDILLMHEGPDGAARGQRGLSPAREILLACEASLVIRGHAHWDEPFAQYPGELQVLNVDARVVILTRSGPLFVKEWPDGTDVKHNRRSVGNACCASHSQIVANLRPQLPDDGGESRRRRSRHHRGPAAQTLKAQARVKRCQQYQH